LVFYQQQTLAAEKKPLKKVRFLGLAVGFSPLNKTGQKKGALAPGLLQVQGAPWQI